MRTLLLVACLTGLGFSQSTPLDTLLQGKEYKLPPLDSTYRSKGADFKTASTGTTTQAGKEAFYMVQFDALADFDAAQTRRGDLQRRTGLGIQLVFDSPFYKLRAGGWAKKEDAEDLVRQLAESNIQAFVVKVK
jgi:hypothetical protein